MNTRRNLVQVEIRCKQHESFAPDCDKCCFVRRLEDGFRELRVRRQRMVTDLKNELAKGGVILIDLW